MRKLLFSTTIVAFVLILVRGGNAADLTGNSSKLRAGKSTAGAVSTQKHVDYKLSEQQQEQQDKQQEQQQEVQFERKPSEEEIKALMSHRQAALPAYQTAKEQFDRVTLHRKARFDRMLEEGEKAAFASGDQSHGFIYGKMAVLKEETRREQANRRLLHRARD
ncbi:hypothetical protein Naga_100276g8 [Nannochloropsis gaditana]|uniref:Uncharacterized protein n=1 Tax=Nannochloropsis gaditana TaxID=72520 RepID=W7TRY0_9STRA|nr:hypothetical protein Naga_100276g8 [Nannochloropsis gaditana]